MKNTVQIVVWVSFFLSVFALLHEALFDAQALSALKSHTHGFPPNSRTLELTGTETAFVTSQEHALKKRLENIPGQLIRHASFVMISMMFMMTHLKRMLQRATHLVVETLPKPGNRPAAREIFFVSIILTSLIASAAGGNNIIDKYIRAHSLVTTSIFCVLMGVIIIPAFYLVIKKLLKIYSIRFITACYLAYFVKAITEFIALDDVNLDTMRKADIAEFSTEVQDYLKERGLADRVYIENKKSATLNAALAGWGSLERIEIYGDHKNLTQRELEAVLMHEIGHSQDVSLIKKISVLFVLKLVEMIIVMGLYHIFSDRFSDEIVSKNGAFIILAVIYIVFANRWLLVFHKLTSQVAEFSADKIAKNHGYGKDLAKVLYDITIKGESNLRSTWLFNSLKSYHPTVYDRIEYLRS